MSVEECYEKIGGSYAEVSGRIPGESLVRRFLGKFLSDDSYANDITEENNDCRRQSH